MQASFKNDEGLNKWRKSFKTNPESLLNDVLQYLKIDNIKKNDDKESEVYVKNKYNNFKQDYKKYKKKNKLKKLLYNITLKGKYCPKFLWTKNKKTWSNFDCPATEFILVRQAEVHNLFNNTVEIRKYDKNVEKKLYKEFQLLKAQINKEYASIRTNLIKMKEECSTEEFWRKYLGI